MYGCTTKATQINTKNKNHSTRFLKLPASHEKLYQLAIFSCSSYNVYIALEIFFTPFRNLSFFIKGWRKYVAK